MNLFGAHGLGAVFGHCAIHQRRIEISHIELGAAFLEQLHQFHADMAQALDRDAGLAHFFMAELAIERGHQRLQRAVGGERSGIAGAAMHLMHAGEYSLSR